MLRRALVSLLLAATPPAGAAALPPGFYQATAIVTGTDMRQRPLGFATCLREVLRKLTGQTGLRDNPGARALEEHADALVESFAYVEPRAAVLHHDDQGTYDRSHELTVRFKPDAVDAAVASLGLTVWRGERPLIAPVIVVRTRDPDPFLLSIENPRGAALRAALVRVAAGYGVGVHLPDEAELAAWAVDTIGPPNPVGAVPPGQLRVTGALSFNIVEGGWVGSWSTEYGGREHRWEIHRVGYDQALDAMVRGAVEIAAGTGSP